MEVFDGHRALARPLAAPAIAIGNFDGVHLGHRALLEAAVKAAGDLGGEAAVLTFDPHPAVVLAPERAPVLITTKRRKLELLAASGIDACILEPFTRELAALSPEQFVADVLVGALGARHVVIGYDFTYGHRRGGNAASLRRAGAEHGFAVEVIEPIGAGGQVASSSAIRRLVAAGDLAGAHQMLGRDHELEGVVTRGAGRGRELGFPTANIEIETELLPPPGIYATRARIVDGPGVYGAATSLGTNPTFGPGALTLEAYLLDFEGDLYGRRLCLELVEWLRPERRFSEVDDLVAQIRDDVVKTRAIALPPNKQREKR